MSIYRGTTTRGSLLARTSPASELRKAHQANIQACAKLRLKMSISEIQPQPERTAVVPETAAADSAKKRWPACEKSTRVVAVCNCKSSTLTLPWRGSAILRWQGYGGNEEPRR